MSCLTDVSLDSILSDLEMSHQSLKRRYLREFGSDGLGSNNNGMTLKWLRDLKHDGELVCLVGSIRALGENLRRSGDLAGNYKLIRQVYAVSPSLHEVWFFDKHLRYNFRQLFQNRLGLKAYLTSSTNGTLDISLQGICTTVVRQTVLLENMVCSALGSTLMDQSISPSTDVEGDIQSIIDDSDMLQIGARGVVDQMPRVFAVVRGLLQRSRFKQLRSPSLLKGWSQYAPCAINCGPIFQRRTSGGLIDILRSIPSFEETGIRAYLRSRFEVDDIFPDDVPISLA